MRLYEFWRDDTSIDFDQFGDIRILLGTGKFYAPELNFKPMKNELAICSWSQRNLSITIHINQNVLKLKDNTLINRLIAHELCHEAEYILFWQPKLEDNAKEFAETHDEERAKQRLTDFYTEMDTADHGPQWQKYADMVNSVYGPNYVTKTSDKTYDLTVADRKWYQIWKKRTI
jgi:hypothetical protein